MPAIKIIGGIIQLSAAMHSTAVTVSSIPLAFTYFAISGYSMTIF